MKPIIKKTAGLAYMPVALLTKPRWQGNEFTFLILTYYKRFDNFKQLMRQLDFWYPNIKKLVYVNGRNDNKQEQEEYLTNIKAFLLGFGNVAAQYFDGFVPPSRLWNLGFIASPTEKILVLNDSVTVSGPFVVRQMLEHPFCKINNSFSNYIIGKSVIAKIGWFDENLAAGASETDGDMEIRMFFAGLPTFRKRSLYVTWRKFNNPVVWDKKLGGVVEGKTSQYNTEYINKKWHFSQSPFEGAKWFSLTHSYVGGPAAGFETPDPYPEVRKQWQEQFLSK